MGTAQAITNKRQFTGTVYILHENRVLLIYHKKHQKWLPPGGHLEENELPHEGAIREAYEETGLRVEIIEQENIHIDRPNAKSISRPFLCLLENIPEYCKNDRIEPAHQHIDFIFLARPTVEPLCLIENPHETEGLRWFSREEIEALQGDVDLFEDVKNTILFILTQACALRA